jgi:hypothetical protein
MEGGAAIAWVHVAVAASYGGMATHGVWSAATSDWVWVTLRAVSFLLTLAASVSAVLATVHGLRDAAILQALIATVRFAVTAMQVYPRPFDPSTDEGQRAMCAFAFAVASSLSAAGLVPVALACARDYPAPKDARLSRGLVLTAVLGLVAAALMAASELVSLACGGLCAATLVLDWLSFVAGPLLAPALHVRQAVAVSQTIAFLFPSALVMFGFVGAAVAVIGSAAIASSPLESAAGGARLGLQAAGVCVAAVGAVLFFAINTHWFRERWVSVVAEGAKEEEEEGEGDRETDALLLRGPELHDENGASMHSLAAHVQSSE